jgi:hypothetical protein
MFGFGKKKTVTKMPDEPVAYTMLAIANMTKLDPTALPNELRDAIMKSTLISSKECTNKYDFCANYMIGFALVLHGVAQGQKDAGWQEKSDRVLQAAANFLAIEKANITKPTYDKLQAFIDGC